MSCQKGSGNRSRPQKYQNSHAFKNNLHDTSHQTKFINSIQVVNVCERCKKIIEWKIKYKKYKPLKAPSKCTKCNEKCVKHAYHIMCGPCASQHRVCPKCGEKSEVIKPDDKDEPIRLDRELRLLLKKLPERKRRTFIRYMNRKAAAKENAKRDEDNADKNKETNENDKDESESESDTETLTTDENPLSRDELLNKLKSLMVSRKRDGDKDFDNYCCNSDDFDDSDDSDYSDDSDDSDDSDISESDDDNVEDEKKNVDTK